jgi:hypothetical protein
VGNWVRPASLKRLDTPWAPAPGFTPHPTATGVWIPEHYTPSPWEDQAPAVSTTQEAMREYMLCARKPGGLSYFAFTHCWSLEVLGKGEPGRWKKFPRYAYLERFFAELEEPSNVHVEKSRQMLMSWAWMVVFLWDITFQSNWTNMVLSRRKEEVDDGGAVSSDQSLLGKVRHLWLSLPPYLQAPLDFHYMVVRNQERNSSIRGEVGTGKAGRGRATKRGLMDEAAWLEHGEAIFTGMHQAIKGGLGLSSTPNGKGDVFARIRFDAKTTFRKFSFHWTEHPDKAAKIYCTCGWKMDEADPAPPHVQFGAHGPVCPNRKHDPPHLPEPRSPWYDHEARDMTPEAVASELDISYEKSRRGRVFGMFDSTRQVFDPQLYCTPQRDDEPLDAYRQRYLRSVIRPGFPCVVGWDFGVDDATSLVLGQVVNEVSMKIRWIDAFEKSEQSWDFYHTFVNAAWQPIVREITHLDLLHYGDPSGKARQSDLMSWVKNLRSRERPIIITIGPRIGEELEWLDFIHNIIRKDNFEVSLWCTHFVDALANYHYPTDESGNPIPGRHEPVHDKHSHSIDAMKYVYMFRWSARLYDIDKTVVSTKAILDAGRPDPNKPPQEQPPVDSTRTPGAQRLNYF